MPPHRQRSYALALIALVLGIASGMFHLALVVISAHRMLTTTQPTPDTAPKNNFAIATVLLGGDEASQTLIPTYLSCLRLISRRLPANIARVCLYDTRVRIGNVDGWEMIPIPPIAAPHNDTSNHYTSAGVYAKLHVWNMTSFDAVLYLDLDTLPLRSVYPLFEVQFPLMRAANMSVGMVRDTLAPVNNRGFNAGVMLIHPSALEYSWLVSNIDKVPHSLDGAEQNYLNEVYKGRIFQLPSVYNVLNNDKTKHSDLWRVIEDQIVILHFVAKPWSLHQCVRDWIEDTCLLWHWI
jgi:lipopolysaccharide biosynthesis glycosyltransferase